MRNFSECDGLEETSVAVFSGRMDGDDVILDLETESWRDEVRITLADSGVSREQMEKYKQAIYEYLQSTESARPIDNAETYRQAAYEYQRPKNASPTNNKESHPLLLFLIDKRTRERVLEPVLEELREDSILALCNKGKWEQRFIRFAFGVRKFKAFVECFVIMWRYWIGAWIAYWTPGLVKELFAQLWR